MHFLHHLQFSQPIEVLCQDNACSVLVCHAHKPIILPERGGWQDSVTWLSGVGPRTVLSRAAFEISQQVQRTSSKGKENWTRRGPTPVMYVKLPENMH